MSGTFDESLYLFGIKREIQLFGQVLREESFHLMYNQFSEY